MDQSPSDDSRPNEKAKRDINFTFLKERYEPLIEDEAKEEKKRRKKESYKKAKKVGFVHFNSTEAENIFCLGVPENGMCNTL